MPTEIMEELQAKADSWHDLHSGAAQQNRTISQATRQTP